MLDLHLTSGRLSDTEHEERCALARAARTRGEIEALFTDLPAPHPDLTAASRPNQVARKEKPAAPAKKGRRVETPASRAVGAMGGVIMAIGIPAAILLTIFLGLWWMFIVVPGAAMVTGAVSDALKKPAGEA